MMSQLVCLVILLAPTCLSQSLTGQCPDVTSACGMTLTPTLHARLLQSSIPPSDVNGLSLITRDVILSHITNNFDLDTDGCLTQSEWNQTHTPSVLTNNDYTWIESLSSPCDSGAGANISTLLASNLDFTETPENFNILQPLMILSRTCEASSDLYSTDCDCAELPAACRDPALSTNAVCASYNAQVADRLSGCILNPPEPAETGVLAARSVCDDVTQVADSPIMQVLCAIFSLQDAQQQDRLDRQTDRSDSHGFRGHGLGNRRDSDAESNEWKVDDSDDSDERNNRSKKRKDKTRNFFLSRYF